MATKKAHKKKGKKAKGLKSPLALIPVAQTAGKTASKVNADTNNSLSWIAVAVVAVGAYAAIKLIDTFSKASDAAGGLIDSVIDNPNHGGGNVDGKSTDIPEEATINGIQAETLAMQVSNVMGSFGKLNEREIIQILGVFTGKTPKDYQMISNAFGLVRRNPVTGEIAPPLMGFKMNLTDWLTYEMQPEGINRLRQVMPGVF